MINAVNFMLVLNNCPGEAIDDPALFPNRETEMEILRLAGGQVPVFINEFWTSKQRQASSIHEISYRACFKPQLPRFFIRLLTEQNDLVYDPFSGRGTTAIEAALLGRKPIANDINPLSQIMSSPRLNVPTLDAVGRRLGEIPIDHIFKADIDLSMFFHPHTESEILSLKNYLQERRRDNQEDSVDSWIGMVATNRLTGHSKGFFSVYTLPPNQAVTPQSQIKINLKRNQEPAYRDTRNIIYQKTHSLLRNLTPQERERLHKASRTALFLEKDARDTDVIPADSIQLTVTSPPFLDVVQYSRDNWLRCWFNQIKTGDVEKKLTMAENVLEWSGVMAVVFRELYRITREGGWVAFEVGEVRGGKIKLEEYVVPGGLAAGFTCAGILINRQEFTKTSHIWGVKNNSSGTNTNRIVMFQKTS